LRKPARPPFRTPLFALRTSLGTFLWDASTLTLTLPGRCGQQPHGQGHLRLTGEAASTLRPALLDFARTAQLKAAVPEGPCRPARPVNLPF